MVSDLIKLRPVQESDLPLFFEFMQDQESRHMAAFTPANPTDREWFNTHWSRILADPTCLNRTIVFEDEVVGNVAKFIMFEVPQVTYWIDRRYWGKGIATAALQALLAEWTERPIYAAAAFDNIASSRVLEKCGFQKTGHDSGYANARGKEIEEILFRLDH